MSRLLRTLHNSFQSFQAHIGVRSVISYRSSLLAQSFRTVGVHTRTWALYGCGYSYYWFALFPTEDQQNKQFQVWQLQYLQIFFDNPSTV